MRPFAICAYPSRSNSISFRRAQRIPKYKIRLLFTPVCVCNRWVVELSSGTALALLLTGDSAVERLREACGPYIPEVARHLREGTIRAVHGVDTVRNAVQCTDLPLDGPLECKFVFSVLA